MGLDAGAGADEAGADETGADEAGAADDSEVLGGATHLVQTVLVLVIKTVDTLV